MQEASPRNTMGTCRLPRPATKERGEGRGEGLLREEGNFKFKMFVALLLCTLTLPLVARSEERLWLPGKINDTPVHLALDTGAEATVLFRQTAVRLGLHVTEPPPDFKP